MGSPEQFTEIRVSRDDIPNVQKMLSVLKDLRVDKSWTINAYNGECINLVGPTKEIDSLRIKFENIGVIIKIKT